VEKKGCIEGDFDDYPEKQYLKRCSSKVDGLPIDRWIYGD